TVAGDDCLGPHVGRCDGGEAVPAPAGLPGRSGRAAARRLAGRQPAAAAAPRRRRTAVDLTRPVTSNADLIRPVATGHRRPPEPSGHDGGRRPPDRHGTVRPTRRRPPDDVPSARPERCDAGRSTPHASSVSCRVPAVTPAARVETNPYARSSDPGAGGGGLCVATATGRRPGGVGPVLPSPGSGVAADTRSW